MDLESPLMERKGKGEETNAKEKPAEGGKVDLSDKVVSRDEEPRRKRSRERQENGRGGREYHDKDRDRGARDYGDAMQGRFRGRRGERPARGEDDRWHRGFDQRAEIRRHGSGRARELQDGSGNRPWTSRNTGANETLTERGNGEGEGRARTSKFSDVAPEGPGEGGVALGALTDEAEDARPVKRGRGNFTAFSPSAEGNLQNLHPEFVPKSGYFYEHDDRGSMPERRNAFGGRSYDRRGDFHSDRRNGIRPTDRIRPLPRGDDRWVPGQDPEDGPQLEKDLHSKDAEHPDGAQDSERRVERGSDAKAKEQDAVKETPKAPRRTFRDLKEEPNGDDKMAVNGDKEKATEIDDKDGRSARDHGERGRGFEGRRDRGEPWASARGERSFGGSVRRDPYGRNGGTGERNPEPYRYRGDLRHSVNQRRGGGSWGGGGVENGGRVGRGFPKKVEKWGHDLFEELSQAPPPAKNDEDDEFRAKVQALLAS